MSDTDETKSTSCVVHDSRGPHVLVTDDADDLAIAEERGVEHRADAERRQVRGVQLSRCRGECRLVRLDDAHALERPEVRREVLRPEHRPLGVPAARALEEVEAADRAPLLDEEPDAASLDADRVGGELGRTMKR